MSSVGNAPRALIIKGGGVKGLAYLSAIEELQKKYTFDWFVGTSAGAITAILLGAGYTLDELRQISKQKDFRDFFDASRFGSVVNFIRYGGLYTADAFTDWMNELLSKKLHSPVEVTLGKLPYRVTIFASRKNKAYLCYDSVDNPDVPAAHAARCSMSIPFVFVPEKTYGQDTFDGGVQNNYPVKAFLDKFPGKDFIGLYLGAQEYKSSKQWWLANLFSIVTEASDVDSLERNLNRTVVIDPTPIGTLDFGLSNTDKEFLLATGKEGALGFLDRNSPDHKAALITRDTLKAAVVKQRATQAAQKKRVRRICLGIVSAILLGLIVWSQIPRTAHISLRKFLDEYEGVRDDRSKLEDFNYKYDDRQVNWDAVVIDYLPDKTYPALEIAPTDSDVDPLTRHLRATFQPGNFVDVPDLKSDIEAAKADREKKMPPAGDGKSSANQKPHPFPVITIKGLVSEETNPVGAHLKNCKIVVWPK